MPGHDNSQFLNGAPAMGGWISLTDPAVVELFAEFGFDFLTLDMEHSPMTIRTIEAMARAAAAATGSTTVLVRLPWNDPVVIKRVLDVGVGGVVVPMVETAEQARRAVSAVKYPPDGGRGVSPLRASRYYLEYDEYLAAANDDLVTIVQIESEEAVENIERIVAVDGLDAIFLGPSDLAADLDHVGDPNAAAVVDSCQRVIQVAHEADVPVGTVVVTVDDVETWMDRDIDYLNVGSDVTHLIDGLESYERAFDRAQSG